MVPISIPADQFPALAYDGTKTFAGILQSYFIQQDPMGRNIGISRNWQDNYAAQIARDYIRRVLPVINRMFGPQKPMHEYRAEDFEAILDELNRIHHYADSTMLHYRRLLWLVYRRGVFQNEYADNIMWDIEEEPEENEGQAQNHAHTLSRLRKSFSIEEDIRMLKWFASLDPETATGEEIGLALMYFLGVRDNEACGASFGDFQLMENHPDMAVFTIGNTTSLGSNRLKPGGKTPNAPRYLPLFLHFYQFINERKKIVQQELVAGHITLPDGIDSVEKLPVVCKGMNLTLRSQTRYLSAAGRTLFAEIGISKSVLKWLLDTLVSEDFKDTIIEEKDPTPYLLRRNTATRLYNLDFPWKDIQYWIAHDIESVYLKRNYYSDEETLYKLGKKYGCHPIFEILSAMVAGIPSAPEDPILCKISAGTPAIVDIEAREPNTPIVISVKSDQPFSMVLTTKEASDLPDPLVFILNRLRSAYWKEYQKLQECSV